MPVEVINLIAQGALSSVFFYLYWKTDKRLQEQQDRHDQDMQRLQEQRINDLRQFARLTTDLEGNYSMPAKAA